MSPPNDPHSFWKGAEVPEAHGEAPLFSTWDLATDYHSLSAFNWQRATEQSQLMHTMEVQEGVEVKSTGSAVDQ